MSDVTNRYRIKVEVGATDLSVDPHLVPDRIPAFIAVLDKRFPNELVLVGGSSSGRYYAEMPVDAQSIQQGVEEAIRAIRIAAAEVGLPSWPIIGLEGRSELVTLQFHHAGLPRRSLEDSRQSGRKMAETLFSQNP